jgi:hypothetical protein
MAVASAPGRLERRKGTIVRKLGISVGVLVAAAALVAAVAVGDAGKKNNKTFEYAVGLWIKRRRFRT